MAPKAKVRRPAKRATPADRRPTSRRQTRRADRETPVAASYTGNARDTQRPWTPLPDPFDAETYWAWGRKHYGEDWFELRETMLRERNFLKRDVRDDHVFLVRQAELRKMEREREEGKLVLDKGKTWEELLAWARWHYGEVWYEDQQALARDKQAAEDETLDPAEREKRRIKADKRSARLYFMQIDKDEAELTRGRTWDDIMAWLPTAEQRTALQVDKEASPAALPSPTSSTRSDSSRISTFPPTPTDARRQALDGPLLNTPREKLVWTAKAGWGYTEWSAVHSRLTEADYARRKWEATEFARTSRSRREEDEACEREQQEQNELRRNRAGDDYFTFYAKYEENARKREEAMKALDLRHKAWMQEQINTPPQNQEEMDRRFDRWEIQGISRQEGNRLARMYGFPERPRFVFSGYVPNLEWPPPRLEERLHLPVLSHSATWANSPPKDEAEMEARFRYWDGRLSRAEQDELARMYGFGERLSGHEGDGETREQKQQRTSPRVDDASRRTLGGRVAKTTGQGRKGARSGTTRKTQAAPSSRKRPDKTDTTVRASRRLAGLLPEYGMLPERREARPLHNTSMPPAANTAPTKGLGPRARAKPQGTAKVRKQRGAGAGKGKGRKS
ncbi:hypothetical protein SPBR_04836 [Sporothrix brasiliensis 5110]|uniref:Uncharacterized protein n=1 Tax=Sporothrix brasiliensis 5110 TaxID=1398154 RepID=A0A0C2IEW4_9PEZI|nr:uncharacterized protein SPBR_04836 [Sporothrix brasiliensis 5110]KIH87766.1 hypothetical protein SPBR_04836 [Sporothrix brasiliensis 5110]